MRTIKKRNLRSFLFACLGLTVATITFALDTTPGPPGRPSAYDIEAECCKLIFRKPLFNGGASIQLYIVEYKSLKTNKWALERSVKPQFSIDNTIQSDVDNRVGKDPVVFRATAQNYVGRGMPSEASYSIIFGEPF